jgi:hypothetical protein
MLPWAPSGQAERAAWRARRDSLASGSLLGPAASLGGWQSKARLGSRVVATQPCRMTPQRAFSRRSWRKTCKPCGFGQARECSGSRAWMETPRLHVTAGAFRGRQDSPRRRRIVAAKVAP